MNWEKSMLYPVNVGPETQVFAEFLECEIGSLPTKYSV